MIIVYQEVEQFINCWLHRTWPLRIVSLATFPFYLKQPRVSDWILITNTSPDTCKKHFCTRKSAIVFVTLIKQPNSVTFKILRLARILPFLVCGAFVTMRASECTPNNNIAPTSGTVQTHMSSRSQVVQYILSGSHLKHKQTHLI